MNKEFVYNYLNKREAILPKIEQEQLRDEIYNLKKSAIGNLKELVTKTKDNLEKNGVKVIIVNDYQEAMKQVKKLCTEAKIIAKAKSNTLDKLNLKSVLADRLAETDLGAYIVSQIDGDSDHPVLPAVDLKAEDIAKKFSDKFSGNYPVDPKGLTDKLKTEIKEKILTAEIGLTGANAVTADGQIMLLENEGNISLITRLPKMHIAVCGVEKIVPTAVEAVQVAKAATVWGTGQLQPTYISFIAGPSKTADIENELIVGVQGAQEVILILIEDDVYGKIGGAEEESLYCLHCGACYNLCATWNLTGQMPKSKSAETVYNCTLCQNCTFNCPAKINWQNIVRISRDRYNKEGRNTESNLKMIENIRQFGNPFGEVGEKVSPDELFCC
jgi:L-lactate utilization protein LutB